MDFEHTAVEGPLVWVGGWSEETLSYFHGRLSGGSAVGPELCQRGPPRLHTQAFPVLRMAEPSRCLRTLADVPS